LDVPPKNEGKRVHVPPDEKTCGRAADLVHADNVLPQIWNSLAIADFVLSHYLMVERFSLTVLYSKVIKLSFNRNVITNHINKYKRLHHFRFDLQLL
jgi:hypothetical protein